MDTVNMTLFLISASIASPPVSNRNLLDRADDDERHAANNRNGDERADG
jgi:hypothetical protein